VGVLVDVAERLDTRIGRLPLIFIALHIPTLILSLSILLAFESLSFWSICVRTDYIFIRDIIFWLLICESSAFFFAKILVIIYEPNLAVVKPNKPLSIGSIATSLLILALTVSFPVILVLVIHIDFLSFLGLWILSYLTIAVSAFTLGLWKTLMGYPKENSIKIFEACYAVYNAGLILLLTSCITSLLLFPLPLLIIFYYICARKERLVYDVWLGFITKQSEHGYVVYDDFLKFIHKDSMSFAEFLEILRFLVRHIDSLDIDFCFEIGYGEKIEKICGSHTLRAEGEEIIGMLQRPIAFYTIHELNREPKYFRPIKLKVKFHRDYQSKGTTKQIPSHG